MTAEDSIQAVKLILAAYPSQRQRMSDEDIRLIYETYTAALIDLPFDIVRVGITKLVKTSKWLPTIAEIRGSAVTARDGRAREGAEGWGDVLAAISRHGVNRTPGLDFEFVDKLVDRVVHAIGWRELCLSEFQIADRARFIELYEQIAEHDAIDRTSGLLSSSPSLSLPGGTRALSAERSRMIESSEKPAIGPAVKLELVPAEGEIVESQGDMIKRFVAEVLSNP